MSSQAYTVVIKALVYYMVQGGPYNIPTVGRLTVGHYFAQVGLN